MHKHYNSQCEKNYAQMLSAPGEKFQNALWSIFARVLNGRGGRGRRDNALLCEQLHVPSLHTAQATAKLWRAKRTKRFAETVGFTAKTIKQMIDGK